MVDQYGVSHLEVSSGVGPLCGHDATLADGSGLPNCLACLERLARAALDGTVAPRCTCRGHEQRAHLPGCGALAPACRFTDRDGQAFCLTHGYVHGYPATGAPPHGPLSRQ